MFREKISTKDFDHMPREYRELLIRVPQDRPVAKGDPQRWETTFVER